MRRPNTQEDQAGQPISKMNHFYTQSKREPPKRPKRSTALKQTTNGTQNITRKTTTKRTKGEVQTTQRRRYPHKRSGHGSDGAVWAHNCLLERISLLESSCRLAKLVAASLLYRHSQARGLLSND